MLNIGKVFGFLRKKVSVQISGEPMVPVSELAARFAHKFEPRADEAIRADIARLGTLKGSLLAVEDVAAGRIDTRLGVLNQELGRLPHDKVYPRIDLAALMREERWSKSASAYAPCYAVFSTRVPGCFVRASAKRGKATDYNTGQLEVLVEVAQSAHMIATPRFQKALSAKCHSAVIGAPAATYQAQLGLAAEFGVGVPPAVRALVQELQPGFEELYFVTTAPKWYIAPPEVRVSVEPGATLLVGQAHDQFWLVKEFDTVAVPAF